MMFLGDFVSPRAFHHLPVILGIFFGKFLWKKIEVGFAEDVFQLAIVMLAILPVRKRETPLQILAENILRHRLDERMVKRFRTAQGFFDLFLVRDVLDRTFVVKQFSLRVTHGAAIFRDPDDGAVLAINPGLEASQRVVLLHDADEFLAPARVNIKPVRDVFDAGHEFHGRVVTIDARKGDVREQVMSVNRRAKNAFDEMIENTVVIIFLLDQHLPFVVPRDGSLDCVPEQVRIELFPRQIILRVVADDLGGKCFVIRRSEHDDRQARGFRGERGDLKQPAGIGGGQIKQDGVKVLGR